MFLGKGIALHMSFLFIIKCLDNIKGGDVLVV